MAEYQPHVGDIGTFFRLRVKELPPGVTDPALAEPVDLSTASNMQIVFLSPAKRRFVVTAVLTNDGADGLMEYVTQSGDLDVKGRWKMQGLFSIGPATWATDIVTFEVSANL